MYHVVFLFRLFDIIRKELRRKRVTVSQPHVAQYIDHLLTEGFLTPWTDRGESIDFLNDVYAQARASLIEDAVSVFSEPDPTDPSDTEELIADYLYEITGEHRDDIDQLEYASQVVVYLMSADSSRVILNNAVFIQLVLAYELARMVDLSHVGLYDFLDAAGFIQSAVLDDDDESEECELECDHCACETDDSVDPMVTTGKDSKLLAELKSALDEWEKVSQRHDKLYREAFDLIDNSYSSHETDDADTGDVPDEKTLRDASVEELADELLGFMEDLGFFRGDNESEKLDEPVEDVVQRILGIVQDLSNDVEPVNGPCDECDCGLFDSESDDPIKVHTFTVRIS